MARRTSAGPAGANSSCETITVPGQARASSTSARHPPRVHGSDSPGKNVPRRSNAALTWAEKSVPG